ncbi:MAG: hypothetical protein R3F13_19240 [Prosthecobacter sp.]
MSRRPSSSSHTNIRDDFADAWLRLTSVIIVSLLLASCLKFGEEREFIAPNVTSAHLDVIEKRTGIDLPKGSVGMALYSDATGIDPWMIAKIQIPSDKATTLLASKPFQEAKPGHSSLASGFDRPWWTPDQMNEPSTGDLKLPNAMVNWTLGQEDKKHVLYIRWDTF